MFNSLAACSNKSPSEEDPRGDEWVRLKDFNPRHGKCSTAKLVDPTGILPQLASNAEFVFYGIRGLHWQEPSVAHFEIRKHTETFQNIAKSSPLQLGGPCWAPRFCRGPQGQVPNGPITKSNSALPAKILLSTKSRTFHKHKVWQGRFLHATKSRSELWKTSKFITFWAKPSRMIL